MKNLHLTLFLFGQLILQFSCLVLNWVSLFVVHGCGVRAVEKSMGRCMLDCGGKRIEPGYINNTCDEFPRNWMVPADDLICQFWRWCLYSVLLPYQRSVFFMITTRCGHCFLICVHIRVVPASFQLLLQHPCGLWPLSPSLLYVKLWSMAEGLAFDLYLE